MTSNVIYHDFRQNPETMAVPAPQTFLTAAVLVKGRRWFKTVAGIQAAVNNLCFALCGACIGVSALILAALMLS